jgi:glycosyltransferase involved in cell wall biosynthesis
MAQKHIRVSLVIPAYNEEHHLKACLDSVAAQMVRPYEVIVVDNNSTDATATIAAAYPFVHLVHEQRQGVVFARDTGFNLARGDIIARIDVETHLPADWIAHLQAIFSDPTVDAVSGSLCFYDVPFRRFFSAVDLFFRRYLARNLRRQRQLFLYGGNMAIRRTAWRTVRTTVCHNLSIHEDLDLAAHMAAGTYNVQFDDTLRVAISARRVDNDLHTYCVYVVANSRTYLHHGLKGRFYMYPVIWLVVIFYLPLRFLYRSYDPTTQRFSLHSLLEPAYESRVSPISE